MPSFLSVLLGKVKSTYSNYPALISIGVFLVVAFFYSLVYLDNSGISTIDDHFFYFEYAKMVKNEGWDGVKTFEGGYLTKKENGQSKFGLSLFNIVNIPFTYIKNEIDGLKLSDIFVASSALALFYYVLRKAKINYPLFFTFFLIVSPFFMHRLLMGRPYVLTTSLIFLEIFLASRKEYRILFLVTLVHLFWHNSTFWLPLVMVGAVEMARFLVVQKFFYKNIFAVSVATILGMAFLPNFFNLWTWLRTIFIVQEGIMDNSLKVSGVELQTSDAFSGRFIGIDIFFIVAVASITIVIFLYLRQRKILSDDMKRDSALAEYYIMAYASFIFFLIVVFGTMIISGRFYDYYQTTLVFLFAVVVTILQKERLIIFKDVLHKYIIVGSTVFILLVLLNNFIELKKTIGNIQYGNLIEAAKWIELNSDGKESVFIHNWSDFPRLFFGSSKNVYTAGMEPTALKQYNEVLYWRWYNMYRYNFYCEELRDCEDNLRMVSDKLAKQKPELGKEYAKESGRKMIVSIRKEFGSRFIVSDNENFSRIIDSNPDLIEEHFEAKSGEDVSNVDVFKLK